MPSVLVASCNTLLDLLRFVDGEVKGFYTFASFVRSSVESVNTTLSVCHSMPSVLVASSDTLLDLLRFVDGQVKDLYTFASLGCRGIVGVNTTLSVCHSMPSVLVASHYRLLHVLRLVDGQVQSNDTITTVLGSSRIGVLTALGVGFAIPSITIASHYSLLCVFSRINRQIQDMLHTINVGSCVLLCVGVFTSCCIRFTIPYIRCFSFTDSNTLFIEVTSCKYCQIQYMDSTIAIYLSVLLYISIATCCRVRITAPCVRQLIATNYYGFGSSGSLWHDSELESSHTIASEGIGQSDTILTCSRVGLTIPSIGFAVADSNILGLAYLGVINGQVEGNDTIAAIGSGGIVGIIATLGVGLAVPCITIAGGDGFLSILSVVDSQVENLDTGTTMVSNGVILVIAAFSILMIMPLILITCCLIILLTLATIDS